MLVRLHLIGVIISRTDSSSPHKKWFDPLRKYVCIYVYVFFSMFSYCIFAFVFLNLLQPCVIVTVVLNLY